MENRSNKETKKCMRKQKRAQHRLVRDMNVESSDEPTQVSKVFKNQVKLTIDNLLRYYVIYFLVLSYL